MNIASSIFDQYYKIGGRVAGMASGARGSNIASSIFGQYYRAGGKMVGMASGARGLIPKSRGGRIAMGAGGGIAAGGGMVLAMKNRANNNSGRSDSMNDAPYAGLRGQSLQKNYDYQREGGFTDSQAKEFLGTVFPGEDLSGLS
jgi:hypothetical protein